MGGKRENGEKLVAGSDARLFLRQTALFQGLDAVHVAELVSKGRRRSLWAGQVEGGMEAPVDLEMTRSRMSDAMGTVPETLSRAFQQLTQAGAVRAEGPQVHIRDRAVLARVAGIR